MENVDIKHYTVAQVRNWLEHNRVIEGLTSEVISPAYAWSLIHHPDVNDGDPIIATVFDNGTLAAATCAIPEIMVRPKFVDKDGKQKRVWWFPMLWVKPEYRGKGYGLVVIGSLAEVYGLDCAWTAWAVPESIEIFEYLGCATHYFMRYFMGEKQIKTSSFKGKLAKIKQDVHKWWHKNRMKALPHYDFEIKYITNIDDDSYDFICKHSTDYFILSSQKVINWRLQYPGRISMPLTVRVKKSGSFFSNISPLILNHYVQVWHKNELIGLYQLRQGNASLSCESIFYADEYIEYVFASVVEHIFRTQASHFETESEELAEFVKKYVYFPRCTSERLSLSISPLIPVPERIVC